MKRSTFAALVVGALAGLGVQLALAQPIVPGSTVSNVTATGTVKAALVDAGNVNVAGRLWVNVLDAGALNVANALTVGGNVTTGGYLIVGAGGVEVDGVGPNLYWSSTAAGSIINTSISAASAGATAATAAHRIYPVNALDATDYVLSVGDAANAASLFYVTYAGKAGLINNSGTCTLNGGSPATCTVTVTASAKCFCSLVGTTAAIAAMNCAVNLSGTTLTVTAANAANANVNVVCDR